MNEFPSVKSGCRGSHRRSCKDRKSLRTLFCFTGFPVGVINQRTYRVEIQRGAVPVSRDVLGEHEAALCTREDIAALHCALEQSILIVPWNAFLSRPPQLPCPSST